MKLTITNVTEDFERRKNEAIKSAKYLFEHGKPELGLYLQDNFLVIKSFIERCEPPAQPETEALKARIAELDNELYKTTLRADIYEGSCHVYKEKIAAQAGQESINPYNFGVAQENWRRGFGGEQFIGYAGSSAAVFYNEGKNARTERDVSGPAPINAIAIDPKTIIDKVRK